MLDPKSKDNAVDYGELLKPPEGFLLSRAIGTTYSLDLLALLAVPVAMYYSKPLETDFEMNETPFDVFDSISKASKTVTIFCQKGKIKVPKKFNKLISLTEDCICEITPDTAYSSFHPKCWWLWFSDPRSKEKIVRFCILSRNLTFDRCWDVSYSFEGMVTSGNQKANKSMIEMFDYLNKKSGNIIDSVYRKQLYQTNFEKNPLFKSWKFHPIRIGKNTNPLDDPSFKPETLLIMSPFIDNKYTDKIASKGAYKSWLFSRRSELLKLNPESYNEVTDSYHISDTVVNGEFSENMSEEIPNTEPDTLDLHAKLYIGRKKNKNTWFLGSANLTAPAFTRNIEAMIELISDDKNCRPESILKELISNDKEKKLFDLFESDLITSETTQENLDKEIRKLIYDISSSGLTGELITYEKNNYFSYKLKFNATKINVSGKFKIYLRPLSNDSVTEKGKLIKAGIVNEIHFKDKLKLSQVSKYFVFTIMHESLLQKEFIVKAEIDIDNEARHGKILAEIIDSKDKFLQYLKFLLSNSGIVEDIDDYDKKYNHTGEKSNYEPLWNKYSLPLYEELLKTASQHPDKIKSIDLLITKLKTDENTKDFISLELVELWEVFKKVLK